MSFLAFIQQNWHELLFLTRQHMVIVVLATGFAVCVGLPLGILLTRVRSLRIPVLGFANVMQTVPSLALFGLLIPIPFIGGIGARTAVIALALYALLPVIRNTVTGIEGVDAKVTEAATAMGMTGWQRLRMVELPLAMPVILAGIRVAVVISVGVATIAALIGGGGLGTYIFRGLRQNNNEMLLAGAAASALLALGCDIVLGALEGTFRTGARNILLRRTAIVSLVGVFIAFIFLFGSAPGTASDNAAELRGNKPGSMIVVGSKDFTESVILAEILSLMLERQGVTVERKFELGGNLPHNALLADQIDVYPEYTGTAFTDILGHEPLTDPEAVYERTQKEYEERFRLILSPPLGFANDFAILVRGETARAMGLTTISDAVPISKAWQAGFGQDFMSRADGYQGFSKAYGFQFQKQPLEMDLSLTYRALAAKKVDVIAGNSTDGLIGTLDLFQLEDDRRYFPPYQAVFVAREEVADILAAAFEALNKAISTEDMRKMNYRVDGDKISPKEAAEEWLNIQDSKR